MKKLLALLLAFTMCISLAACSSGPDKQPAIDALNKASGAFNETANLINENLDLVDEELVTVCQDMSGVLTEYVGLLESDSEIAQEDLDKIIAWCGEVEQWSKDAKSEVEAALASAEQEPAGSDEPAQTSSGGIWDFLEPAAIPEGLAGTGWEFAGGYLDGVEMEQADAEAVLAQYGGMLQIVFEDESTASMVQGGGMLNGAYSATSDGYTLDISFDNSGSNLQYAGLFTDVGGTLVLMLLSDATGMNAIYFTQINEN